MRTQTYLLFCLLFPCLSPLYAQQTSDEKVVQDLIVSLEKKTWELVRQKDKAALTALIADDGQDVGELGIWDKEKSIQGIDEPGYVLTEFSLDQIKFVRLAPDVALLTYQVKLTGSSDRKPLPSPEYIGSVWVNRGGKWLNALFQDSPAEVSQPTSVDLRHDLPKVTSPNDHWSPPKASIVPADLGWLIGNWRIEKHYYPNPFMQGKKLTETEQCAWAVSGYYVICNSKDILDNDKPVREIVTWSQNIEPHVLRFVDISPDDPTDPPTAGWCRIDGDMWYCYSEPRLENGKTIHLRFVTKNTPSSANGNSQFSEDGTKWLPLSDDSWTKVR